MESTLGRSGQAHAVCGQPCGPVIRALSAPAAAKTIGRGRSAQQQRRRHTIVQCISAPEKAGASNGTGAPPAFLAWAETSTSKKRDDLKRILIIGAGPIVIGQVR